MVADEDHVIGNLKEQCSWCASLQSEVACKCTASYQEPDCVNFTRKPFYEQPPDRMPLTE